MTSPFKTPPKITATCNNCKEEFTYNDTYGTGRLCQACHDKLDDPTRCEYELNASIDSVTRELHITVGVSHSEPTQVTIPAYHVETHDNNDGLNKHSGFIADLTVTSDSGSTVFEETWKDTRTHVLDKHSECNLNVNSIHSVGASGHREWNVTVTTPELFTYDTVTVDVVFPSIRDDIPESTLSETVSIPSYLIDLDE